MKIDYLKIIGIIAIIIIVGVVLFGAYKYYFSKPMPTIINNTYQVAGNNTVNPETKPIKQKNWVISVNAQTDKTFGGSLGYLF
jgi:hypothetical protein